MRAMLAGLLLVATRAVAQDCPQHITPWLAGWFPPPVCAGQGRFNPVTQDETQWQRDAFQFNYLSDRLICLKTGTHPPTCDATARTNYRNAVGQLHGAVPCLDPQADGSWSSQATVDAFIDGVLVPTLYCQSGVNSTAQNVANNAIRNAVRCVGGVHLEGAIQERTVAEVASGEAACLSDCYVTMGNMAATGPACLDLVTARALCDTTLGWMQDHSDLAFCAVS